MEINIEIAVLLGRILFGGSMFILGVNNFLKLEKKIHLAETKRIPFPKLSVVISSAIVTAGGFFLMINTFVEVGVFCIWIFLIPASLKVHNFWTLEQGVTREIDMNHFIKNISLLGASLLFLGLP